MLHPVAPRSCSSFCRPPDFVCLYVLHRYVPFAQERWKPGSWETLRRTPVTPGLGRCAVRRLWSSLPAKLCHCWLLLGPRPGFIPRQEQMFIVVLRSRKSFGVVKWIRHFGRWALREEKGIGGVLFSIISKEDKSG